MNLIQMWTSERRSSMNDLRICLKEEMKDRVLQLKCEDSEYEYTITESVEKIVKEIKKPYFFLKKRSHDENYDVDAIFDSQSGAIHSLWMSPTGRVHLSKDSQSHQHAQQRYLKEFFQMLIEDKKV